MQDITMQQAIDGAHAVKVFNPSRGFESAVVWYGGTTFNVYGFHASGTANVDTYSLSDEKGRPVDREKAVESMEEYVEAHTVEADQ